MLEIGIIPKVVLVESG